MYVLHEFHILEFHLCICFAIIHPMMVLLSHRKFWGKGQVFCKGLTEYCETKYLGITLGETSAVEISEDQFKTC